MGEYHFKFDGDKWCWHCSNIGVGGRQGHTSEEHEKEFKESLKYICDQRIRTENRLAHEKWLREQPEWNAL